MKIHMNTAGIAQTNGYLVADEISQQAVIIDAPDHTIAPLIDIARQNSWEIVALWLTHGHFDHIADHKAVTDAFPNATVLIHPLDEPKLKDPRSQRFMLPFTIPGRSADAYLSDGQRLILGSHEFEVIHTPGHAPGHVMFYCRDQNVLLGGDLIICGSVGRTDLPDSNHADLLASIRRVMQLPPQTRLLAGHGEPTTLGEQLQLNEFVIEALASPQ